MNYDRLIDDERMNNVNSILWYLNATNPRMATGEYSYQSEDDGLCMYKTKKAAISNCKKSFAAIVYSPTGKVVWTKH